MLLKVLAILDKKSNSYQDIRVYRRTEEALRSFGLGCNDEKSTFHMFAEDFSLYELGTFDDETGLISPYPQPKHVIDAHNASVRHRDHYVSISLSSNSDNQTKVA